MKLEPSIRSKKSSSSRTETSFAPVLTLIGPVLDSSFEAFGYRIYMFRKRSQHFDEHVAWNVAKFIKRLRSKAKEAEFEESSPIPLLVFL